MLLFVTALFVFPESFSFRICKLRSQKSANQWFAVETTKETSHSFIVRIRIETRELKDAGPIWRGDIEHVQSGTRAYFDQLDQIAIFLIPYIEEMGIEIDRPKSK